ncbi:TetR/AcrR family transcriptional regulator [Paenibacillus sp. OV219]|uniref:TetR/AcrR family transcriptional regulator n=1 Tax=Paenibacillus sp. OV219 TaxID=1884377 RepID=UPI0008B0DC57|nr:TetR/AcrR family transcriptional regulator [Paenibacillus sp. OV219]SEO81770.1 transcriptional regulator, TetR family [Paenibacillus sp. OV219]
MSREEKKQATLQRISEAAFQLFSEKGFEETSVAEITQAAGVAKGTFFNYFATKEELLFTFQKDFYLLELFSLNDRPGPYTPLILTFLKELGDSMSANPALLRSALQRFLAASSADKVKAGHEVKLQAIVELFAKGQQAGEFTHSIAAEELASTALQLYFGTLVTWSTGMGGQTGLGEQLQTAYRVFLRGITLEQD